MMDDTAFQQWAERRLVDGIEPLTEIELLACFEWSCRYGSANCWAGLGGEAAAIVRKLLLEIARLKA